MLLLVALWAFAEAILFFIVADVPISVVAVKKGFRAAAIASVAAALAASAGGLVVYLWAASEPAGAARTIAALPAIDATLIETASEAFRDGGYPAMLHGSLTGIPYKLYALAAGTEGRPLLPFLLLSPLIRLPRFLLVSALVAGLSRLLSRRLPLRARLAILGGCWALFYAFYFAVMPG